MKKVKGKTTSEKSFSLIKNINIFAFFLDFGKTYFAVYNSFPKRIRYKKDKESQV